jgi:hypothetical protein
MGRRNERNSAVSYNDLKHSRNCDAIIVRKFSIRSELKCDLFPSNSLEGPSEC